MIQPLAALQAIVLTVGGLTLAVPADLACCAGVVDAHGAACCESSSTDVVARACCSGDTTATAATPGPSGTALVIAEVPPSAVSLHSPRVVWRNATAVAPPPRAQLFRLHSALLL